MQTHHVMGSDTVGSLFDAVPVPTIVVDSDVRVLDYNTATEAFMRHCETIGLTKQDSFGLGNLGQTGSWPGAIPMGHLHYLVLKNHYIRYAVLKAYQGHRIVRRCMQLEVNGGAPQREFDTRTTCSPFQDDEKALMLLIVEVNTSSGNMEGLIRVCSACHKVIDEDETLARIESYSQKYMGVRCSHGLCPACFKKELAIIEAYPDNDSADRIPLPEIKQASAWLNPG